MTNSNTRERYFELCNYMERLPVFNNSQDNNKSIQILNSKVNAYSVDGIIELINEGLAKNEPIRISCLNSNKLYEMNNNSYINDIVNESFLVIPDGYSIVIGTKILHGKKIDRITGIDLMNSFINYANNNGKSIYLLGSSEKTVNKAYQNVISNYPRITVYKHNGYFDVKEMNELTNELLAIKPDIIFIGISSPLKEYLMNYLQSKGIKSVILGVGGSFEVLANNKKRAPLFIQKIGMEWLFRVVQEPKRLFKRYLICNSDFAYRIVKEKVKQ